MVLSLEKVDFWVKCLNSPGFQKSGAGGVEKFLAPWPPRRGPRVRPSGGVHATRASRQASSPPPVALRSPGCAPRTLLLPLLTSWRASAGEARWTPAWCRWSGSASHILPAHPRPSTLHPAPSNETEIQAPERCVPGSLSQRADGTTRAGACWRRRSGATPRSSIRTWKRRYCIFSRVDVGDGLPRGCQPPSRLTSSYLSPCGWST